MKTNLKSINMKYIVYKTINTINNKIYIGVHKTENPDIFDSYIGCGVLINNPSTYMNPITPFQAAVKKYGPLSFKRIVLKVFNTAKEAFDLEKEIVNYNFIRRKDTYNAKLGGIGGYGAYVKIYQFDLEGNLIKEWESITEASEFFGVSHTAILNADKVKGSCKKYFWSRNSFIDINNYSFYEGNICYQYDSDGNYLETYNSLYEAAKCNTFPLQSIERAVKGGYKVGNYYYSTILYENYKGKESISFIKTPLYVYNLEGFYITTLKGKEEIQSYFGITGLSVINVAFRTERPYKQWQLSNIKVDRMPPTTNKRNTPKKVGCFTLTGDLIEQFDSITKACKKYGTGVQKVLRDQQQQCKGYLFKYIS